MVCRCCEPKSLNTAYPKKGVQPTLLGAMFNGSGSCLEASMFWYPVLGCPWYLVTAGTQAANAPVNKADRSGHFWLPENSSIFRRTQTDT